MDLYNSPSWREPRPSKTSAELSMRTSRHPRHLLVGAIVLAGVLLSNAACGTSEGDEVPYTLTLVTDSSPNTLTLVADSSPTESGAGEPNLSVTADGRALLSWLVPADNSTTALRFSTRDAAGTWAAPQEIIRRNDLFVNWADFPSVVSLADGRLLAHWLQRNGEGRYAYDVRMAESRDGGLNWGERVTPHTPGIPAEHGFAALLPTADSGAAVVLLDGGAGVEDSHGAVMHLAYATWGAQGGVTSKAILDHRVCDCCQTGIAMTTRGPVVVYRDRSDEETRDISVVRLVDGAWTEPRSIHADNWKIDFCPVNGPAISSQGDNVAIVWFAAPNDSARVLVVFSTDAGATFSAPVRIDGGSPTGRVDIELLDGGTALVSWIERTGGDKAEVWARVVRPTGFEPRTVVSTSTSTRSSGFPRMVRTTDGVLMAWTMPGKPSAVRTALLRIDNVAAGQQ